MARVERGDTSFSSHNLKNEALRAGDHTRGVSGYPSDKSKDVATAVSEALAWLEAQALLVPDPGSTGDG